MLKNKKLVYFENIFILAILLILLSPFQANSFPQNNGGSGSEGGPTLHTISGKVIETMNGGGYTYALVEKDGTRTWVAMPMSNIVVGSEIICRPGMMMNNFPSRALKRTFERIVFTQGIKSSSGTSEPTDEIPD